MTLALIVPSRGRPARAEAMAASALATAADPGGLAIVVAVDPDDPELGAYRDTVRHAELRVLPERLGYSGTLNAVAGSYASPGDLLGAFGDDVLFRTRGWDAEVRRALRRPGLAYPNDLSWGRKWATAVFASREVVDALGWLAYPGCRHQYVDNVWWELGTRSGRLAYLESVVCEHMHPAWGKAEDDEGYRSVYSEPQATIDHDAFGAWRDGGGMAADLARLGAALA